MFIRSIVTCATVDWVNFVRRLFSILLVLLLLNSYISFDVKLVFRILLLKNLRTDKARSVPSRVLHY